MFEQQQHRQQNALIRRIVGVKRVERTNMKTLEPRVAIVVEIVKRLMKWSA